MMDAVLGLVALVAAPVLVIWWFPYLVHELGHWLGAVLAGATFDYVPLGPLIWVRVGARRRVQWQVRRFSCGAMQPTAHVRRQLFVARLGGPLLNVAIGVPLLWLGFGGNVGTWVMAQFTLIVVGLFMAMHGLIWLLPWRPYGVSSDGLMLFGLLRPSAATRRWIAIQQIARLSQDGQRPRDWPADVVGALVAPSDGSVDDVAGALTLYYHLLDNARFGDAVACLNQARAAASQHYMHQLNGQLVLLELAYVEARKGDDPSVAVQHLVRSAFVSRTTLARVLAAIQLSYAQLDLAERSAQGGLARLEELRPGFALMEKDLLNELVDEAQQRRSGGTIEATRKPMPLSVDVSLFRTPDQPLREPAPPPGVRSARTIVGLVAAGVLALGVYLLLIEFAPSLVALTLVAAIAASVVVVWIRLRPRDRQVPLLREILAAAFVFLAASPVLLGELLRPNGLGYIWFSGVARPCAQLGLGHDVTRLTLAFMSFALASFGFLLGTRIWRERLVPRRGAVLGVGLIALWILTITSDHGQLALILGCR